MSADSNEIMHADPEYAGELFTVVLLYPPSFPDDFGPDAYVALIRAPSSKIAAQRAIVEARSHYPQMLHDMVPLLVARGRVEFVEDYYSLGGLNVYDSPSSVAVRK